MSIGGRSSIVFATAPFLLLEQASRAVPCRHAAGGLTPKLHDGCISRSCTHEHTARSAGSHSSVLLLLLPTLLTANKTCLVHTTQLARHNPDKPMLCCVRLSVCTYAPARCAALPLPELAICSSVSQQLQTTSACGSTSSLQSCQHAPLQLQSALQAVSACGCSCMQLLRLALLQAVACGCG